MPRPIEEQEEFEQQLAYESDSDEVVDLKPSDITKNFKAASSPHQPLGTRREVQDGSQQDLQQVSPVPLIVSDIVRRTAPVKRTALPTHKPTQSKEKAEDKGRKRAGDPERQDQGPLAKKNKGTRREIPCVYCVRRLANDPKWICREALVSQHGTANYKGLRCGGCVAAHVSCRSIPAKAIESVRALVKTADDVAASDGTNKIQLLAAYEAAIGPVLKAIIVIPDPQAPKAQKRKRKPSSAALPPPKSTQQLPNGSSPWPANPTPSFSSADTGTSRQQQYVQTDHASPSAPSLPYQQQLQQQHRQHHNHQEAADLERLERLALRRRKVEALESISHTAALFLAEFMTFAKRQGSSSSSAGGANHEQDSGGGQSANVGNIPGQNSGMVYAAAAAGMAASIFHPSTSEHQDFHPYSNRNSTDANLDAINDEDSDSDSVSSDASTTANHDRETVTNARIPSEQGEDDIEMHSGSDMDDGDDDRIGKQEDEGDGDEEEGGTSPAASEVKVEEQ